MKFNMKEQPIFKKGGISVILGIEDSVIVSWKAKGFGSVFAYEDRIKFKAFPFSTTLMYPEIDYVEKPSGTLIGYSLKFCHHLNKPKFIVVLFWDKNDFEELMKILKAKKVKVKA